MHAICNREGLLTAFQVAAGVVPARSPKPILQHVKFEIKPDGLAILMATDLEIGVRYKVSGVRTEVTGQAILPTKDFTEILRELPDETVELETTDSGVELRGATSQFQLPTEDPEQFPDVPDFGDAKAHQVKSGVLGTMIKRTIFAVAPENTRYALHSVLLDFGEDGQARMVATDGRRLALMTGNVSLAGKHPSGDTLLAPKALALLQKIPLDPEEGIDILIRDNDVLFRASKVVIYSRLVEGRFPRYQDVFPAETRPGIALPVTPFHGVLRQAKIVTTEESRGVDFEFASGQLTLTSRGKETGKSEVKLAINYAGEPFKVTFDPQLIIDALRVVEPADEVALHYLDPKKASVLRTADGFEYVLAPLTRSG